MKCPHCEYKEGEFNIDLCEMVGGEEGDFYRMPVKLERTHQYDNYDEVAYLIGCPKCLKTFIIKK